MEPLPSAEAEAVDMLLSLPAHLLDHILMRLKLRDAVRTSVLSWAWRRRWESVAGLALSFPKGTRPSVITRVLLRYTGPIISRFASYAAADNDDVDDWVIALSRRSVQSITMFSPIGKELGKRLTLHSSIFSCDRLVSLSLDSCNIPPVPRSGFAGFPVLEKLYLYYVDFTDEGERGLQAIIRGSPLLRLLWIRDAESNVDCVIEALNLQTLVLTDSYDAGWRFGRLPRLQYANIDVAEYAHGGDRLLEFFTGVSQVQKLILHLPANSCELNIDRISFTFHNLKRLEVSNFYDMDMDFILLLYSLLRSSPNLVELKIEFEEIEKSVDILSEECYDAQWTDGMCANLQVVRIESPYGWLPLSFMKLILSKASLLRILSMDVCLDSQDDRMNELLTCRRASAHAQILFKEDLDSDTDGELSDGV